MEPMMYDNQSKKYSLTCGGTRNITKYETWSVMELWERIHTHTHIQTVRLPWKQRNKMESNKSYAMRILMVKLKLREALDVREKRKAGPDDRKE